MYYLIHGWRKDLPRGKKCSSKLALSKLQKTYSLKSYRQPFWRAVGTGQKIHQIGQNRLCMLVGISKMAGLSISNYQFFLPHMPIIDAQKANLLEHFFPLGSPSRQPWVINGSWTFEIRPCSKNWLGLFFVKYVMNYDYAKTW